MVGAKSTFREKRSIAPTIGIWLRWQGASDGRGNPQRAATMRTRSAGFG
jgi:hypothetical protein